MDVYDTVSRKFLARRVKGRSSFTLAGGTAAVMVMIPVESEAPQMQDGRLVPGSVVIDWMSGE